ncbi:phosphoribosylformylglycinamidine cyclo-ligase [Gammaproteobacteria bacterium]|nr:phosphoribosylformylglycinamidine cyclo-ligase [Gammaproteobacteria bacterium]
MANPSSTSYRDAGVDIEVGDALIERIKPLAASTRLNGSGSGLGGFGALHAIDLSRFPNPVLVSGTDGVGTKLKLAIASQRHDTIGIDLVAMCANDILVTGATPLFFLDYYATGKLDVNVAESVISGIAEGCRQAGMELAGGETAEMPGMYGGNDYDLAGFAVGCVDREQIIDSARVEIGDALVALPSSGVHSNGYSLVRHILDSNDIAYEGEWLDQLLMPTRIYCKPVLAAIDAGIDVHAMAHITGGGLPGNLNRSLPAGCDARIDTSSWTWPTLFSRLAELGPVEADEMYRTFNCGIGFVMVVPQHEVDRLIAQLATESINAWQCGDVVAGSGEPRVILSESTR